MASKADYDPDYDYAWIVRLEVLFAHAVAHQYVTALRLVRYRQIHSERSSFRPAFNLAGLPQELFGMILDQVREHAVASAYVQDPMVAPFCDCMLADNVFRQEDVMAEFNKWCEKKLGHRLVDPLDTECVARSRIRRAFQETKSEYCEKALKRVLESVANGCDRCLSSWCEIWKTMSGLRSASMASSQVCASSANPARVAFLTFSTQGLDNQQLIIRFLDDWGHLGLRLSPTQDIAVSEENGAELHPADLVFHLQQSYLAVLPKKPEYMRRHYLLPDPEVEFSHNFSIDMTAKLARRNRRNTLHYLIEMNDPCLVRIPKQRKDDIEDSSEDSDTSSDTSLGWEDITIAQFLDDHQ